MNKKEWVKAVKLSKEITEESVGPIVELKRERHGERIYPSKETVKPIAMETYKIVLRYILESMESQIRIKALMKDENK